MNKMDTIPFGPGNPLPDAVINDLTDKELILDVTTYARNEVKVLHHVRIDLSAIKRARGRRSYSRYYKNHMIVFRSVYNVG
jgi:hypothetical protein